MLKLSQLRLRRLRWWMTLLSDVSSPLIEGVGVVATRDQEPRFVFERLGPNHDRASFLCTREPALQTYFADPARAARDHSRSVSAVHVLVDVERERKVAGYFTLSNRRIVPGEQPQNIERKTNRCPHWGALKLGRMARDDSYRDESVGAVLVARAFVIALRIASDSGSIALIVDAKNDRLVRWYQELGFTPFPDAPRTLFITNAAMAGYLDAVERFPQERRGGERPSAGAALG